MQRWSPFTPEQVNYTADELAEQGHLESASRHRVDGQDRRAAAQSHAKRPRARLTQGRVV